MNARYRVQYTEIKPGGHRERQDDLVRGTLGDVRAMLARRNVVEGSITVTEHTKSDGIGHVVDMEAE